MTEASGSSEARVAPDEDRSASPADEAARDDRAEAARRAIDLRTLKTLAAVGIAWAMTVAPAAFRGPWLLARATAALALAAGLLGPILAKRRRDVGRHLGISACLALCVVTWLLAAPALHPARLDPIRAALGAVAWGVFALSWSDPWAPRSRPASDAHASSLQARAGLPALALPIASTGVAASLALLVLAWRVRDPERALLAQAVALACAIAVIGASAVVATARGKRTDAPSCLTPAAIRPLVLLVTVAIAGAVVIALR